MLYQIIDGTLAAGSEVVLEHFDFEIRGNEKVAIVGPNGAGKTTLLRLLAGELELERDDKRKGKGIVQARNMTIGMLSQHPFFASKDKKLTDVMGEWSYQHECFFTRFGFKKEDREKKIEDFSGGEQTKIALIQLLLDEPELLLLDEPTNHLDVETVEWLEDYIKQYPKAVVMVSHDRFFLDQTVERIYAFEDKKLRAYAGNYTQYRRSKEKEYELQLKKYLKQQEEIRKLEENISRFRSKPKKAAFARSRKKILERMEMIEAPKPLVGHHFRDKILPERPGNKIVFEAEALGIGYEHILRTVSFRLRRGQKVAVIGANGSGKSTFLKTITGQIPAKKGKFHMGDHMDVGYFDQSPTKMDGDCTVLEDFVEKFPGRSEKEARKYLADYLFSGAKAHERIDHLSGGERARLALAEILAQHPNFLVLDEPTNHMDVLAKETMESAFRAYEGSMLFVSHDRYFTSQIADALLIFDEQGVSYYPFGYQHYVEQKERKKTGLLRSDEEQAMIDDLNQVPKGENLLGHAWSKEKLQMDWEERMAREAMEECRDHFLATLFEFFKYTEEEILEKEQRWTEACIAFDECIGEREIS